MLLDLPPELLSHIFELACPPSAPTAALPLTLVHPLLSPLALPLLFRQLTLTSPGHVRALLASPALERHALSIRSLRFIPLDGDGGGRGGVGRGIGTAETLDGKVVDELLVRLKSLWEGRKEAGLGESGLEELDVASVDPLFFETLQGDWLAGLRKLTLGPNLEGESDLPEFTFRLTSLALHNNHWSTLPGYLLEPFLDPCTPFHRPGSNLSTLRHLDLSSTYNVDDFSPFLDPFPSPSSSRSPTTRPANHLPALHSLLLPPFETASHLSFAHFALSSCSPSRLAYLELPPLSDATSGTYDVLWSEVARLLRPEEDEGGREDGGRRAGEKEVGVRGWASAALVETVKAVLAAAGMDSPARAGEGRRDGLKRLRFTRLFAVEDLGKIPGGGAELIEQAEACGIELVCGPKEID
ncbi:hypothetical protein JCM8547_009146 [Rhodosporidiobolus lusitaniae]